MYISRLFMYYSCATPSSHLHDTSASDHRHKGTNIVLSSVLCSTRYNHIRGHTTIVAQIMGSDESEYRKEIDNLNYAITPTLLSLFGRESRGTTDLSSLTVWLWRKSITLSLWVFISLKICPGH